MIYRSFSRAARSSVSAFRVSSNNWTSEADASSFCMEVTKCFMVFRIWSLRNSIRLFSTHARIVPHQQEAQLYPTKTLHQIPEVMLCQRHQQNL